MVGPRTYFTPGGATVSTPDGSGGSLTAIDALRTPSGDGRGQVVFFWHNQVLISTAPRHEALGIKSLRVAGPGRFAVTYGAYQRDDAMCCPTRFATVTYRWDGRGVRPMTKEPIDIFDGDLTVKIR